MDAAQQQKDFVDIQQLSQRSGRAVSSLRRDVRKGKLEAFQPGGRGGKLLFRSDAIQRCKAVAVEAQSATPHSPGHLPGRRPAWMVQASSNPLSP
jgi:hypothetical protein